MLTNEAVTATDCKLPKGSSTTAKLARAAALAAMLVPLAAVPSEAETIHCGFGDLHGSGSGSVDGDGFCGSPDGSGDVLFQFDDGYSLRLQFFEIPTSVGFFVEITDTQLDSASFQALLAFLNDGAEGGQYVGVPLIDSLTPFVVFTVEPSVMQDPGGNESPNWAQWQGTIDWTDPTGGLPTWGETILPPVRLVHGNTSAFFHEDMCVTALDPDFPNYIDCTYSPNAFISSGDTDFQILGVAEFQSVPEPASLVLFGTGLAGILYRRRRRGAPRR